ncbi:MAG: VCBS repeat-containing protein, partial [Verrucomicrobia bacterium]|nr:VCBS repeat-containing protein [Verrucomicrobiota bacterium]
IGKIVMTGASNWEDGQTNGGAVRLYDFGRKASGEILLGVDSVTGPLASADVDGDGAQDLFVGARTRAGRYPESGPSRWYRNQGGRFVVAQTFDGLGLVSAAVFTDLNQDGAPDLAVASEWGSVRVFYNESGRLVERDVGLKALQGWWTCLAVGDFDEDGFPDLAAGNWGSNHEYRAEPDRPRRLWYGDLRGMGSVDMIESYFPAELNAEAPHRGLMLLGREFPFVREVASTFDAYGRTTLQAMFGERLQSMQKLEAHFFLSAVFLNRGQKFELRPLPQEAQWSPIFGLVAADCDGDGHEDLAATMNFFGVAADGWRKDAGRGLILRGDGKGGFQAHHFSGLAIYGEGRGLAAGDFNGDGRVDLLAAQVGGPTHLYRNRKAVHGVRVSSLEENGGVGISLRGRCKAGWGPLREIRAGNGSSSQDSTTLVITSPAPLSELAVRQPGKEWVTNQVEPGAWEVQIDPNGVLLYTRRTSPRQGP